MKSTGSVVTYLIFEFSFRHVLFTCIRVHSAYTVYENALLFYLEYLTRSLTVVFGPQIQL